MKSSVINSGNGGGGNSAQQHPQTATNSAPTDGNNNPQHQQNPRYPFYDFDMDDPRDFFTNPALRSRLNRMRNPWNVTFGAPRKRRGSNQAQEEEDSGFVEDPHDSFFSKFDPHWSEAAQWPRITLRKRQPSDHGARSDFFDYFPAEFRQYIPDDFGFHHPPMPTMHQHPTPPRQAPPQTAEKPRFCDAAMQTDEDPPTIEGASHTVPEASTQTENGSAPLKQHGLRNTVDLGQKSPPEERAERAKSAPPDSEGQTTETQTKSAAPQPEVHQAPPPPQSPSQNVRHIPIIVERSEKVPPPAPQPPKRGVSQKKFVLRPQGGVQADVGTSPPPAQQTQPGPSPQVQEVPIQVPQGPPTPSAESIAKIQQIQKEVLELMFKVEAFQGTSRADKEYLWLDEMLTRNLLKLDTIDTQGNDSIRLARREAIKCIQASLAVLEAKADGTAKMGQENEEKPADDASKEPQEESKPEIQQEATPENDSKPPEVAESAPEEVDKSKIPIPLPPIEPRAEEVTKSEEENDKQPAKDDEEEKTANAEEKPKKKKVVKKVNKKESNVDEKESTVQNDNQQT
ncbi:BAG domain-containing protein Samui [Phlebotomus papatasi]|uniref:BAG domain-containing protein Samui n=1 Tax=Phlebotomus papatasi TaxID=29031 RepID=UPI002483680C|nr:BAG domain-containing protein Samui [Phlebotomus papatasi]